MTEETSAGSGPIGSQLVRDDPSFEDLVVQFVEGLQGRLDNMEKAIRASDFESLRVAAHQLKGSGGGYGYPILTKRAAELERSAKDQALDECFDVLTELREICSRVVVDAQSPL
jgi:HPt (histidine-containing phosphotransfer) domain-containing protein